MGEIERVQRIPAPLVVDPGRVHKPDGAKDGRNRQPQQEGDVIELTSNEIDEEVVQPPNLAPDGESHLDIAV